MTTNDNAIHVLDARMASRLQSAVYQLAAAIDELLWRSRIEPETEPDVGYEESVFWESHAALLASLRRPGDDDVF